MNQCDVDGVDGWFGKVALSRESPPVAKGEGESKGTYLVERSTADHPSTPSTLLCFLILTPERVAPRHRSRARVWRAETAEQAIDHRKNLVD